MDKVWTVAEIVRTAEALDPETAAKTPGGVDFCGNLCVTEVIQQIYYQGTEITLDSVNGKIGAGYIRVSMDEQANFGFSIPDQITRIIDYFVGKRQRFVIYSDSGLGGGLATNDPFMQARLWEKKAEVYENSFRAVFFANPDRYTATEQSSMNAFLADAVARLRQGKAGREYAEEMDEYGIKPRGKNNIIKAKFRPGLSCLLRDQATLHTVCVNDNTRLSRSQLLFADVTRQFRASNVELVGLTESLTWANTAMELGNTLIAAILPVIAEHRLYEACLNTLRGIAQRLHSGKPHAKVPEWIEIVNGEYKVKSDQMAALRRMVELYLNTESCDRHLGGVRVYGGGNVAAILNEEGHRTARGGRWNASTVRDTLINVALIGKQRMFGKDWPVFPSVIDEATFRRIQDVRRGRDGRQGGRPPIRESKHIMRGLLRCWCGHHMGVRYRYEKKALTDRSGDMYVCFSRGTHRATMERRPHCNMQIGDVDAFFNDMMARYGVLLLSKLRPSGQREDIERQIERLEADLTRLEVEREEAANQKRAEAEEHMKRELSPENPYFATTIRALVQGHLFEMDARLKELRDLVQNHRDRLQTLLQSPAMQSLQERVQQWESLSSHERNALLRTLFDRMEMETYARIEADGTETPQAGWCLKVWLRVSGGSPVAMRPIFLQTRWYKNGHSVRRMPTVDEWFDETFWEFGSGDRVVMLREQSSERRNPIIFTAEELS